MAKQLIIGIDVRDLQLAQTGTKTYLEELCKAFRQAENQTCKFHFIDTAIPVFKGNSKITKYLEHFRFQIWKQLILPLRAWSKNCDILLCTDNFVPMVRLGFQTVPVFHDAFFFENPEHYGKLWLSLYHHTAIPAAKKSAFIVTPTRYAQQQIHRYTGIPLQQLKVVYEGPKAMVSGQQSNIIEKLGLQNSKYVLHAGSMYKRKNIPALIYAFKKLKTGTLTHENLKLVLAGPSPASKDSNDYSLILEAIDVLSLQQDVILTGYLSDAELAAVYQSAYLYVFPSINEGFGIPILEAFQYNVPVIVANNSCLPEVGGDAVLQFDPFDIDDIAAKMKMVLENEQIRLALIHKGKIRLKAFSWQQTAAQLLQLFMNIKKSDQPEEAKS